MQHFLYSLKALKKPNKERKQPYEKKNGSIGELLAQE